MPRMYYAVRFETPENVELSYRLAGLGTRFVAWFVDSLLLLLSMFLLAFVLVIAAASSSVVEGLLDPVRRTVNDASVSDNPADVPMYFLGLFLMVWGLGGFVWFGLCELLLRGQTPGKKMSKIRVVKLDGFALDPVSIFVRNIFRIVDHMPIVWIVPLLSQKSQRLGDMVSGTIVVHEQFDQISGVRAELSNQSAAESTFRFTPADLRKLRPQDFTAVEKLLEQWATIPVARREQLTATIISGLCRVLSIDAPPDPDRIRFLEDLLSAEYRRQNRELG